MPNSLFPPAPAEMKLILSILFLALTSVVMGCEAMYDIAQDSAQRECNRTLDTPAYLECVKRNSESYDNYQKKRQSSLLTNGNSATGSSPAGQTDAQCVESVVKCR